MHMVIIIHAPKEKGSAAEAVAFKYKMVTVEAMTTS